MTSVIRSLPAGVGTAWIDIGRGDVPALKDYPFLLLTRTTDYAAKNRDSPKS
jgi:hypothetical protein